jgi:hypothetical protein
MTDEPRDDRARQRPPLPFPSSLCHGCAAPPSYVRTRTSVFIRCPLTPGPYPRQPVLDCRFFRPRADRSLD